MINQSNDPKKEEKKKSGEEQKQEKPLTKTGADEELSSEEKALDNNLDDPEFDQFDENGGDEDFSDQLKETTTEGENKTEKEEEASDLKGIEGVVPEITNASENVVNKKGQ